MARIPKLTDAKIRDLDRKDKPYRVSEPGLPVQIEVSPKGTKTFYTKYRVYHPDGRIQQVEAKVGTTGDMDLEEACNLARTFKKSGKEGVDYRFIRARDAALLARQIQTEQMEALGTHDPANTEFLKTAWDNYYHNKTNVAPRHLSKMKKAWKHIIEPFGEDQRRIDPKIRTRALTAADINGIRDSMADRPAEFNKFRMALSNRPLARSVYRTYNATRFSRSSAFQIRSANSSGLPRTSSSRGSPPEPHPMQHQPTE